MLGGPASREAHRDMPRQPSAVRRRQITAPYGLTTARRAAIRRRRRRRRNQLSHRRRRIVSCKRPYTAPADAGGRMQPTTEPWLPEVCLGASARRRIVMEIIRTVGVYGWDQYKQRDASRQSMRCVVERWIELLSGRL